MRTLKPYLKLIYYRYNRFEKKRVNSLLNAKSFCRKYSNILYQKEKILGYNLIPEEIYNQLISNDVK